MMAEPFATNAIDTIGFTGHRDTWIDHEWLHWLRFAFPNALWIDGGAEGFDEQVAMYAAQFDVRGLTLRPRRGGRSYHEAVSALYARNREIVDRSNLMVACYDGRQKGGTFYTLKYAQQKQKPIFILRPARYLGDAQ